LTLHRSLFGPKRAGRRNHAKRSNTGDNLSFTEYDLISITVNDLQRMHSPQQCRSPSTSNLKAIRDHSRVPSDVHDRAMARKKYMLTLDQQMKEKELQDQQSLNGSQMKEARIRASQSSDQEKDIVKKLNSCRQRATAFAIRDEQLRDKEEKLMKEREYEKITDLAMEADRLRELARREMEENNKMKKRIADRKVIENQIQDRSHLKLLDEEAREQENQRMLEAAKRLAAETEALDKKKKENARLAHLEALKWNEDILAEKLKRREEEKQEEAALLAYQAARDEALRKREEDEREAFRKKQEIQKKLLESQSRIYDKQADLDELRARRAFEENERRHRKKELEEYRKRKSDILALVEACQQQQVEKDRALELEKQQKQQEFMDAMRWNAEMAQREELEALALKNKNDELRNMLREQMREKEEIVAKEKKEKYREGERIRDANIMERKTIEKIRLDMVEDMKLRGVDKKYFGEMLSLDVEKCLMR